MSVNSKMTAIADEVRTLSGATGKLGLDALATHTHNANTEIGTQEDLIQQIKTALQGKVAGGGSEDLDALLTEQEGLITDLLETLAKKADGEGGDPDLPTGYRRVSYIQFNDAQIVDTGIIGNQDTKIKALFTRESSNEMYLYGCASTGNTASITAYLSSNGSWRFGSKAVGRSLTVSKELIHTSIHSKTGVVAISPTNTYSDVADFETVGSILIGAGRNGSGTIGAASYIGKIFLFEMWSGSTQVLKLIPVVDVNGVYRFWDAIGEKFHDSITDTPLDGGNL